jgi:hypothetical protein
MHKIYFFSVTLRRSFLSVSDCLDLIDSAASSLTQTTPCLLHPSLQRSSLRCRVSGLCGHDDSRFEQLCEAVQARQLLTDALISHSVATLANSDDFFIFTETIRAAILAFSRDASVAANTAVPVHPRLIGLGKGGQRHGLYPPCGVLPTSWVSSIVAPLCYLFGDAEGVFYCTRALYCRSENNHALLPSTFLSSCRYYDCSSCSVKTSSH